MLTRFVLVVIAVVACRPPGPATTITPMCRLARAPRDHADTIRIVVPDAVDPARAPIGGNEAERLVFAQLYEPLLRRDCAGVLTPGLAESWTRTGDSAWRFRLRPGARFSDGSAASPPAVAAVFAALAPRLRVAALGERDLVVQPDAELVLPAAMAEPRHAIAKASVPSQWPAGTVGTIAAAERGVTLTRADGVIAFTWPPGADARDLLDAGADAVLTDQPAALEYAAARGAFDAIPLAWSRTYVVVTPFGRTVAFAEGGGPWRDAVRGEARAASGPYWWRTVRCEGAGEAAPPAGATVPARVVYRLGDDAGRGLAERFVARGASGAPERSERAVGLSPAELRAAVVAGRDYAIVALPRSPADGCGTLAEHGLAGRPPQQLIPLLETRMQLVVRSDRFGVSMDGDGTPRFDP